MLPSLDGMRFAKIKHVIRVRLALTGCRVALIVFLLATYAQAQQRVGYVLEIKGTWTLQGGSKLLFQGEGVPAGGVIRNQSPSDYDRIIIFDLNGNPLKHIKCRSGSCNECRKSGACYDPVQPLPAVEAKPGFAAVFVDVVMKLIVGEPDRYSVHRVRGGKLADGVAQLTGGQLDLSSIFGEQEKDQYYLRFKSVKSEAGSAGSREQEPIIFEWDPAKPSPVSVGKLQPGLYELVLLEGDPNGYTATGISAWTLVSSPDDYEKVSSFFRQASALAQKWQDQVSLEVANGYLRAYLDSLAGQSARQGGDKKDGQR